MKKRLYAFNDFGRDSEEEVEERESQHTTTSTSKGKGKKPYTSKFSTSSKKQTTTTPLKYQGIDNFERVRKEEEE